MDEQMREKFEKWHAMRYGRAQMERGAAGVYKWNVTEDRWLAWQACAAALSQPAAQVDSSHSAGGECGGVPNPVAVGLFVAEVVVSDDDLDMGFSEEFIRGDVRLPNGTYQLYTKATP